MFTTILLLCCLTLVQGIPNAKRSEVDNMVEAEERHARQDCGKADAPECPDWKEFGWCNVEGYAVHCARICGFCKQEVAAMELEERHAAVDCNAEDAGECKEWASFGWCEVEGYQKHCAHECGLCNKEEIVEVELEVEERHAARDCNKPDAPECVEWAEAGWCGIEEYNIHCSLECGFCLYETAQARNAVEIEERIPNAKRSEVDNMVEAEERHARQDCGKADAPECPDWKEFGWCDVEGYAVHCARICGFCKQEVAAMELEERHAAVDCGATDAGECKEWASFGWCEVEAYQKHCAHECGLCKRDQEVLVLEKRD